MFCWWNSTAIFSFGLLKTSLIFSILLLTKLCNILEFDFSPREFFQEKIKIFITKPTPYSLKMHILSMEGIHIWILVAFPFFQYIIFRFSCFRKWALLNVKFSKLTIHMQIYIVLVFLCLCNSLNFIMLFWSSKT